MSLSSSNGVVLEKSLYESFTVLRNIKNIVLTGMIFYVSSPLSVYTVVRYITALCFFGSRDFRPSGSGDEKCPMPGIGALKKGCVEDYTIAFKE